MSSKKTNIPTVEETNSLLSAPVRPADTDDSRVVRAPKGGVEGSNFDGGTDGEENSPTEETVTTNLDEKKSESKKSK